MVRLPVLRYRTPKVVGKEQDVKITKSLPAISPICSALLRHRDPIRLSNMKRIAFSELPDADLFLDATYEGDISTKTVAGEPLAPLMGAGNQGGFRFSGSISAPNLVILYTTFGEPNWPDSLDVENGLFVYFGDNRKPGYDLHDRSAGRGGNQILKRAFELAHGGPEARQGVSPFFVFSRGARGRDVVFRGLAAPGAVHLDPSSDLVAIWKSLSGQRFQNYRAVFTILQANPISREWITELHKGVKLGPACPKAWRSWVRSGKPKPLTAETSTRVRTAAQQLGETPMQRAIAAAIYDHFSKSPVAFEYFAADVVRIMDPNVTSIDVTRPSRDGGRDGVGKYRVGLAQNCVTVDFALEAKCYALDRGVGVKAVSRLISRLRHRQFGILVTTSYLAEQAYTEIVEDGHPIIICSGGDVAELLVVKRGFQSAKEASAWLTSAYPLTMKEADLEPPSSK